MKHIVGGVLVITLWALLSITTLRNHNVAHAATGCTLATLTGNYGFTENVGFLATSPRTFVPAARLGLITFSSGTGSFSISLTTSINGDISNSEDSGSYTVNSNCTGSITFTNGIDSGESYNISIVSGGTEVLAMRTDQGPTITATMKKQ
jgi:hypothetical protein